MCDTPFVSPAARRLVVADIAEFVTSAAGAGDFPRDRLPEIALVGRSNVGKSSLINALVRQPLARTSAAPGKTRLANFYRVQRGSSPPLYLVDLPGYGYARGGEASAQRVQPSRGGVFRPGGDTTHCGAACWWTRGIRASSRIWTRGRGCESQPCPRGVVGTKVDKLTRARTRASRS